MVNKEVKFIIGDRVKLTSLSVNQELSKGFKTGITGTVINFIADEYPVVKWDTPLKIFGEILNSSDCHYSRLQKV